MTDIGVGDLVENTRDARYATGELIARAGARGVVLKIVERNIFARMISCGYCRQSVPAGLLVSMFPSPPGRCWCTCFRRRVDGPPTEDVIEAIEDESLKVLRHAH